MENQGVQGQKVLKENLAHLDQDLKESQERRSDQELSWEQLQKRLCSHCIVAGQYHHTF